MKYISQNVMSSSTPFRIISDTDRFNAIDGNEMMQCKKNTPLPKGGVHKSHAASGVSPSADAVLKSFNSWAFKREQPSRLDMLTQFVDDAIKAQTPVPFILYWGKGPRNKTAEPELKCLRYLRSLADRIATVYSAGAAVKLIFTDTHAELNGHSRQSMQEYFSSVDQQSRDFGFDGCFLSDLTNAVDNDQRIGGENEALDFGTLRKLQTSAAKWYGGQGTIEDGAMRYYRANMIEKRAVETAFPKSIFVTFNGSELADLFPRRLPIFYMYSMRRGTSVKPWFVLTDAEAAASALTETGGLKA